MTWKTHNCRQCGDVFEYEWKGGRGRLVCDTCLGKNKKRDWKKQNAGWNKKKRNIAYRYGVTAEQFQDLLDSCGNQCEGCGVQPENPWSLNVDHCHVTGAVRGMLCGGCNFAVGKVQDSPYTLRRLAKYLEGKSSGTGRQGHVL